MGAELFRRGELVRHIWATVRRVAIGFSLAVLIGIFLGGLMGLNSAVKERLKLIIVLLRPIPPFAWIPLGLIWFGIGEAEMIMIIVISSVFFVAIHTLYGIERIDFRLKQAAKSLGSNRWDLLKRVILPSLLPELFHGMRLALGFCWVAVVGAEIVGSVSGLGYLILDSRNRGLPQMAILGMMLIGFIGLSMDRILVRVKKTFLPWDSK
ncbi:MAG: ABC transporter permease [Candidatus Omnitrophica bacterium]|nr:ABC transporter permease [Candidatus Omnitrophota bacterium]MBU4148912.1 ABC transporter permease [Candidatus Omnitrophota bacterium]